MASDCLVSTPRKHRCVFSINHRVLFNLLLAMTFNAGVVEGCLKQHIPTPPTIGPALFSTTTITQSPDLDENSTTTTVESSHHRKVCTEKEEYEIDCLNGAMCFAVDLPTGARKTQCRCQGGFYGERCEFKYFNPLELQREKQALFSIAFVFSVATVFVIILFVMFFVYQWCMKNASNQQPAKSEQCDAMLPIDV